MKLEPIEFDSTLIKKYARSGPRYTSYPSADRFSTAFDHQCYQRALRARAREEMPRPLSLYFHLPFCSKLCFYCGCSKVVTKNAAKGVQYLDYLAKEMALQCGLLQPALQVAQLHWGGGTPTFFSHEQMRALMRRTRESFDLSAHGEYSIEVDPRTADAETMWLLRDIGFNRISLGVQDFDPAVQRAVNRVQTEARTAHVIHAARGFGFHSINVDLIYGLPKQSVASFARTLERIVQLNPERIAIYNYAHLPQLFAPQQRIQEADLPSPDEKLDILQMAIQHLAASGYVYIGMDHFAKPDDALTRAQDEGTLQRNFQGYATHAECDLIAMGMTGIGSCGSTYSQNARAIDDYYARLDEGLLPIERGLELSRDDRIRRAVIHGLMCNFVLPFASIEPRFLIDFAAYFSPELARLKEMQDDGLVHIGRGEIRVTPKGRLLIRNICMVFDKYLHGANQPARYSKVI